MKAMIFAAGLGTRLKPFTDHHPKALAEVCGKAMLGLVIEKIKSYGISEFVVNVHHFSNQIIEYLKDNNNFGVTIHISDESRELLDTGGGILAARRWLDGDEDVLVHNADILTDFDISSMVTEHKHTDCMASLLVDKRQTKRYLLFDTKSMRMKGWTNIDTGAVRPDTLKDISVYSRLAFGGVHIISPSIFPVLQSYADCLTGKRGEVTKFSITDFYIALCSSENFHGYKPEVKYHWHDIGKPESLISAERDFRNIKK